MGHMNTAREEEVLMAERAADWLRRLDTGDLQERTAFMAWLKESPRHVREILLIGAWDKVLGEFDPKHTIDIAELVSANTANVVSLQNSVRAIGTPKTARRTVYKRFVLRAAAVAGLTFGVCAWWLATGPLNPNIYTTAVGEQRAIELKDGSVIHLNTHSRVKVDFSNRARDVQLLAGQAIFKVQQDTARPFRVYADNAIVQALGTQFDVYLNGKDTKVAVIEGAVRVSSIASPSPAKQTPDSATKPATLTAGDAAKVAADGQIVRLSAIDVMDAAAWQQRRLVFRKENLAQIAAEFNRYNSKPQIRIEGGALQARQFNGVFDADDPESLLLFMQNVPDVEIQRGTDEVTIRLRAASTR